MGLRNRPGSKELRDRAAEEVVIGRGTPYLVTEEDIEDLEVFPQNHSGHFVSEMQATQDIYYHNGVNRKSSPNENAAIARVRAALSIDDWHPDVAIKAFHDLDLIFFDGHLRGNVCACWSDNRINYRFIPGTSEDPENTNDVIAKVLASELHKVEHTVRQLPSGQKEVTVRSEGVTCWIGYPAGQCRILLNADSILGEGQSPWQKMWAFLLHEMCVSTTPSLGKPIPDADIVAACV